MSENGNDYRLIKNKPRSKKLNPKVDLAAMISISFLLIMFFMVTEELSRPQAMDLGLPDNDIGCGGTHCGFGPQVRTITLLLDDNNKIISYRGLLEVPDNKPAVYAYGKEGIRKVLARMSEQIYQATGNRDIGAIVLIKPSKKSNYGNLVDILDEMAINRIPTYAIINDYTPEEAKLLALN
jgi:biopolymer transport protein ExbD